MADTTTTRGHIEITPTLVIGLGGTGMQVLSLFKQRILDLCGPKAPVAFFGIDTDTERLHGASLNTNEFALCDCLLAPDVVEHLDLYPDIDRWWLTGVQPGQIVKGAKMKRYVGRLACYYNFASKIHIPLMQHIQNLKKLTAPEERADGAFSVRNTIRVYVVGSMSGGTGGGFFFDIAVAVRHIIQDEAGVNLPTCVAGILVMPRPFRQHVPLDFMREKVRANFYAGLREIEHLHKHYTEVQDSHSNLSMSLGGVPMKLREPPFSWIYLVDTLNEKGQNITMPQMWSMIATNLCMEVYSSVTNEVEQSVFVNIPRPTPYGSFATASLRVPMREIVEYCTLTCAKEVLENRVARARPTASELDEVAKFLNCLNLFQAGTEMLHETLLKKGRQERKTTVMEDVPREDADQAVFLANREWEDLQMGRSGLPAARDAICQDAAAKAAEVEQRAIQCVEDMLADPDHAYGLEFLVEFMRLLEKNALETCRQLNEQAGKIDPAALEGRLPAMLDELRDTVNNRGGWIHRLFDQGKSIQCCYENWAGAVNAWTRAYLTRCAMAEAAKVFQRLQEVTSRLKSSLKQVVEQVDRVAHQCLKDAARVGASLSASSDQHVLVTNVISPEDLPGIYQEIRADVDLKPFVLQVKPRTDRALAWVNVRLDDLEGTLETQLLPKIRQQFQKQVQALDLFTAARKYWQGSVEQWVKAALEQCSPFCNWNKAVVPANILSFTCVGVENAGRQADLLGDLDHRTVKVASTGDPYEIVIHAITAGYPASAVNGLAPGQDDRFYYERYLQKAVKDPEEQVHVDRRWLGPDKLPMIDPIE